MPSISRGVAAQNAECPPSARRRARAVDLNAFTCGRSANAPAARRPSRHSCARRRRDRRPGPGSASWSMRSRDRCCRRPFGAHGTVCAATESSASGGPGSRSTMSVMARQRCKMPPIDDQGDGDRGQGTRPEADLDIGCDVRSAVGVHHDDRPVVRPRASQSTVLAHRCRRRSSTQKACSAGSAKCPRSPSLFEVVRRTVAVEVDDLRVSDAPFEVFLDVARCGRCRRTRRRRWQRRRRVTPNVEIEDSRRPTGRHVVVG